MNFLNLKIDGTTDSNNKSRIQKNLLNIIEVAIFWSKNLFGNSDTSKTLKINFIRESNQIQKTI